MVVSCGKPLPFYIYDTMYVCVYVYVDLYSALRKAPLIRSDIDHTSFTWKLHHRVKHAVSRLRNIYEAAHLQAANTKRYGRLTCAQKLTRWPA